MRHISNKNKTDDYGFNVTQSEPSEYSILNATKYLYLCLYTHASVFYTGKTYWNCSR